MRIGILVVTDTNVGGKYSRSILNEKANKDKRILSLHGGNEKSSVITSRSGSASYTYDLKLIKGEAENVPMASSTFYKTLTSIVDISKNNPEIVVAPYNTEFKSNILKGYASGTAKISVRFNTTHEFDLVDAKVKKLTTLNKSQLKIMGSLLQGGMSREPFLLSHKADPIVHSLKKLSKKADLSLSTEHRWSSSNICNIANDAPKLDGLGPIGGYDAKWAEYIYRGSITDRALLLALLLNEKP